MECIVAAVSKPPGSRARQGQRRLEGRRMPGATACRASSCRISEKPITSIVGGDRNQVDVAPSADIASVDRQASNFFGVAQVVFRYLVGFGVVSDNIRVRPALQAPGPEALSSSSSAGRCSTHPPPQARPAGVGAGGRIRKAAPALSLRPRTQRLPPRPRLLKRPPPALEQPTTA